MQTIVISTMFWHLSVIMLPIWMDAQGEPIKAEIDQSKFLHRKYHRGQRRQGHWVFGGIERWSGKCFLVEVDDYSATTLQDKISVLLAHRSRHILAENPFLFTNDTEHSYFWGSDVLWTFVVMCGASKHHTLILTKLRKHSASTVQVVSLKKYQLDKLGKVHWTWSTCSYWYIQAAK